MKKKITLYIDTSRSTDTSVSIDIDGKKYTKTHSDKDLKAQAVLPLIDALLKKHKLTLFDISSISVHEGPGSFTGVRVGVAIANSLSFLLAIPINEKKVGKYANPKYSASKYD